MELGFVSKHQFRPIHQFHAEQVVPLQCLSTTRVPGMKTGTETYWHAGIHHLAVEAREIPARSCSAVRSSCLWSE